MNKLLDFLIRLIKKSKGKAKKRVKINTRRKASKKKIIAKKKQLTEEDFIRLKTKNGEAKNDNNYQKALNLAFQSISYLENINPEDIPEKKWPIDEIVKYFPILNDGEEELQKIKGKLSAAPPNILKAIDDATEKARTVRDISKFLEQNPGLPQSELWGEFNIDGRKWAPTLKYAEQLGAIERKEKNRLYLTKNITIEEILP